MDAGLKPGFGAFLCFFSEISLVRGKEIAVQFTGHSADDGVPRGIPWKWGAWYQRLISGIILVRTYAPVRVFGIPAGDKSVVGPNRGGGLDPGGPWRVEVEVVFESFLVQDIIRGRPAGVVKCIGFGPGGLFEILQFRD